MKRAAVLFLAVAGVMVVGYAVAKPAPEAVVEVATLEPLDVPAPETVTEQTLRSGETLSDVFQRAGLGDADFGGLLLALRERINPRSVHANTAVLVRRWSRSHRLRAVDIDLNADSTLRLNRVPLGWRGEMLYTPTVIDTLAIAGELADGASLYSSIIDQPDLDLPFAEKQTLVWELARIYGWELDFSHDMQPGDRYRVVYEREARPDGTSRATRVLVAEIVNRQKPLPAVYFDADGDGGEDYFDPEGRSLELAFLRYPVDLPRITSNFSWQRYHPVLNRSRPHLGTDFGARRGTPVRSTADGVIAFAGWNGGYGNLVKVRHGNGYETRYAHLSRFARGIHVGTRVSQGQVIAYSGDTGLVNAPHLHYELRLNGQPRNPRTVRLPSAPPVSEARMAEFKALCDERMPLLPPYPVHRTEVE
jgi:murein DD-endopeptidase MepM/ murein hydrolase activator NlpD